MTIDWPIGDKIENRWEIHRILRGGMGIVYIVYDHEFHEPYAAKTYQDEIFARNPQIAERFRQEAHIWVNLDIHQNVTRARFVENIQGKPYLFLEYVSGGDLSGWIGTPRLTDDLPQVLHFAIHFCSGMIHALSKGIRAHRDIKPQNCLVTKDHTLKVTDFGLAKIFDDTGGWTEGYSAFKVKGLEVCHTRTGTGAGTPPYMAPEQFEDVKHVGMPADIYGFGVMLYEMVTGHLPFEAETLKDFEQLHKTQPPRTAFIGLESLRHIIVTCLQKDPLQRFADFDVLRKRLGDVYENLTGRPAPKPAEGADLSAVDLSNKGYTLDELGRSEEALTCYDRALQIKPQYAEAWSNKGISFVNLERFEEALSCFDHALQINPQYVEALSNKGASLDKLGCSEEALTYFDRAIQINPQFEKSWYNKGIALDNLGRSEQALSCFDRALQINPQDEKPWYNKGNALANLGRFEQALSCYDSALQINPHLSRAWSNKGIALDNLGRFEQALSCFDRALQINPQIELAWYSKGIALDNLGRFEQALSCYDHAIQINPRLENAWYNKGVTLTQLNRFEEALSCYDRTLQINPQDENAWHNKGTLDMLLGRLEEALTCFEEAQKLGHPLATEVIALLRQELDKQ